MHPRRASLEVGVTVPSVSVGTTPYPVNATPGPCVWPPSECKLAKTPSHDGVVDLVAQVREPLTTPRALDLVSYPSAVVMGVGISKGVREFSKVPPTGPSTSYLWIAVVSKWIGRLIPKGLDGESPERDGAVDGADPPSLGKHQTRRYRSVRRAWGGLEREPWIREAAVHPSTLIYGWVGSLPPSVSTSTIPAVSPPVVRAGSPMGRLPPARVEIRSQLAAARGGSTRHPTNKARTGAEAQEGVMSPKRSQRNTPQHNTTAQYSTPHHDTRNTDTKQHTKANTTPHNKIQCNTPHHTTQHHNRAHDSKTQYNTRQRRTAKHRTPPFGFLPLPMTPPHVKHQRLNVSLS